MPFVLVTQYGSRFGCGKENAWDRAVIRYAYVQEEADTDVPVEPPCAQGTISMGKLIATTKFTHQADISDMACFRPASSEGRLLATIDEIGGVMLANVPVRVVVLILASKHGP